MGAHHCFISPDRFGAAMNSSGCTIWLQPAQRRHLRRRRAAQQRAAEDVGTKPRRGTTEMAAAPTAAARQLWSFFPSMLRYFPSIGLVQTEQMFLLA